MNILHNIEDQLRIWDTVSKIRPLTFSERLRVRELTEALAKAPLTEGTRTIGFSVIATEQHLKTPDYEWWWPLG